MALDDRERPCCGLGGGERLSRVRHDRLVDHLLPHRRRNARHRRHERLPHLPHGPADLPVAPSHSRSPRDPARSAPRYPQLRRGVWARGGGPHGGRGNLRVFRGSAGGDSRAALPPGRGEEYLRARGPGPCPPRPPVSRGRYFLLPLLPPLPPLLFATARFICTSLNPLLSTRYPTPRVPGPGAS